MTVCFLIYRYFPHGGQQRDFLRIALACQTRGYRIRVYTLRWDGEVPEGFDVCIVPVKALTRHRLYRRYHTFVAQALTSDPVDVVVGFSPMPDLDIYYAADPCFAEKALIRRGLYYRYTARYRHFIAFEKQVFGEHSSTVILLLSELQKSQYLRHYPSAEKRMHLLPPGLGKDRVYPDDASVQRDEFRRQSGFSDEDLLLVQVGSGFAVKGVDRSIRALAALPEELRRRCHLFIVGQGRPTPFRRLAQSLGVSAHCRFVGGSDEVQRFLLGSDLMLHPAYSESGGLVLLEGLVCGLPVLTTDTCGHASHVIAADAGVVCQSPFSQSALNTALEQALGSAEQRQQWRRNARRYCETHDLYAMPDLVADFVEKESDDTVSA